jgi:hypothetical protein
MRYLLPAVALSILPVAAQAQPPQPAPAPAAALPSGDELFKKYLDAIGGAEALRAKKNSLVKARVKRAGGPDALLTIWRQAPGKMYKTLEIPGVVTLETWCDGQNAWSRNTTKGASRLAGAALNDAKSEAQIAGDADYKSRYTALETTERTTFAERPAFAVAATGADGGKRTLFFDAEKGFLIGVKLPGGDKQVPIVLTFSDYKASGGLMQPMTVIEEAGAMRSVITYSQVDFDLPQIVNLDPPDEVKSIK